MSKPPCSKCNRAGPHGFFPGQAFPHILCCSSSLKNKITALDTHFLSCFADVKTLHQMEDVNYLRTMNHQPQASCSLRTNRVNPCDLTISQTENCAQADHKLCNHPTLLPSFLRKCFAKGFPPGTSELFRARITCVLRRPTTSLSLLHTPIS